MDETQNKDKHTLQDEHYDYSAVLSEEEKKQLIGGWESNIYLWKYFAMAESWCWNLLQAALIIRYKWQLYRHA